MLPHTRKPPNNFTRTTGWLLTWPNVALIFRLSKVKKKTKQKSIPGWYGAPFGGCSSCHRRQVGPRRRPRADRRESALIGPPLVPNGSLDTQGKNAMEQKHSLIMQRPISEPLVPETAEGWHFPPFFNCICFSENPRVLVAHSST